jgi:Leucine rich repeat
MKLVLIAFVLAKLFSLGFSQTPAGCNFVQDDGLYTCSVINGNMGADKKDDELVGTHNPTTNTAADVKKVIGTQIVSGYLLMAVLKSFTNVEIIEFRAGNIETLNSSFFTTCDKLTSFQVIGSTRLQTIEAKTFSACTSLESIVLKSNHITAVQGDAFEKLASLKILDLSENDITSPAPTAFRGLAELKIIRLNLNEMASLSDRLFETNGKLEEIYMADNKVESLSKALVSKVTELKIFDMSRNKINKTERGFFDKFTQLEKLFFVENVCIAEDFNTVDLENVKDKFETCFKNNDASEIIIYSKFLMFFVALTIKFL